MTFYLENPPSNPIAAYGKGIVHFAPKAKSVIFLHMVGAPSQLDLFDPKPKLKEFHGKPAPAEFIEGKRFAFLRGHPKMMASPFEFAKINDGQEISEVLPHLKSVAGEIAIIQSMQTEDFNHAPAQMFFHSGLNRIGRPSLGSWVTYGLGAESNDLTSLCGNGFWSVFQEQAPLCGVMDFCPASIRGLSFVVLVIRFYSYQIRKALIDLAESESLMESMH